MLDSITERRVRDTVDSALDDLFEKLDHKWVFSHQLKPSELKMVLDDYDMGWAYEDWFNMGYEEWE